VVAICCDPHVPVKHHEFVQEEERAAAHIKDRNNPRGFRDVRHFSALEVNEKIIFSLLGAVFELKIGKRLQRVAER
jgi:hypothetical protein